MNGGSGYNKNFNPLATEFCFCLFLRVNLLDTYRLLANKRGVYRKSFR